MPFFFYFAGVHGPAASTQKCGYSNGYPLFFIFESHLTFPARWNMLDETEAHDFAPENGGEKDGVYGQ